MDFSDWRHSDLVAWVRAQAVNGGTTCPTCNQNARVWKRPIYAAMARTLIRMAQEPPGFMYLPDIIPNDREAADAAKLRYWGLIEPMPNVVRADGSTRAGYWRITDLGRQFVQGEVTLPKWVHLYDSKPVEFSGPERSILDCLGKKFDYRELMTGVS